MRVLAIVPSIYDTSPGQRFRIEQWEPQLRSLGVRITYAPFETDTLRSVLYENGRALHKVIEVAKNLRRRSSEMDKVADFDLVYVFREAALLGPAWLERRIARSGVPMVFDFDDAVFVAYKSPSNGYLSYLKFPSKIGTICRLSAHVMAGNRYLADYAQRFNDNVTIVPTTIDTEKYQVVQREPAPPVLTIGWSGSYSTIQHLDTIRDMLQQLATRENFVLRVIGTPKYEIPGVEVEALQWNAGTEIEDLGQIDIGLMPLPNEKWSKGKCGLKALQYMALGIPTICSPVGVNSTIIKNGENGFIADSNEEWIRALTELLHSADLRKRIGLAGRKTVEEEYSAKSQVPRVLEIFRSVVKESQKT